MKRLLFATLFLAASALAAKPQATVTLIRWPYT
jgi:hypothetical protein